MLKFVKRAGPYIIACIYSCTNEVRKFIVSPLPLSFIAASRITLRDGDKSVSNFLSAGWVIYWVQVGLLLSAGLLLVICVPMFTTVGEAEW